MAFQILLNFFLAFLWMFLQNSFKGKDFFIGYILGLLIIFGLRRFFNSRFYLLRAAAVLNLVYIFIKELLLANWAVFKVILKPKLDMKPGIFAMSTTLETKWEVTVLANLITLTPGTFVIDVSSDNKILYIHAMDVPDVEEAIDGIRNSFEKAILEVSK
ncbi:Na+/H+ antiporter subunit E [Falsibacillus pallidus]|uniref:Multisubunit sodium/proton antiporter MrpE subunit n=1 Tax=Falsibacillus pallidus TaxID=493781 RepID=A0A370FZ82_9BACI|nr:Na+/H+ antiporter subunit E [Falsibacillus pallidus]RDI36941.1 multisubunit sodium/proton antiporter MrpE subunit [Falsibacillus pallidus]